MGWKATAVPFPRKVIKGGVTATTGGLPGLNSGSPLFQLNLNSLFHKW